MHSNLDNGGFPDDFYFTNLNMTLLDVIEVIITDVGGDARYPTILTRSAVMTCMYMTLHVHVLWGKDYGSCIQRGQWKYVRNVPV